MAMCVYKYIVIETKNVNHHIELLAATCSDRGKFKWIAESKDNRKLTIDGGDLFPRLFFLSESLTSELIEWSKARNDVILSKISIPERKLSIEFVQETRIDSFLEPNVETTLA